MNIYEKLQAIRVELQAMGLPKTGKNTYAKYDYYSLSDFLPQLNKLMMDYKISSTVTFTKETATLTLVDCEKPDARIEFTSPMASANLKGVHEIQNLGAVETYQRRYLYIAAFEIVESDVLDLTTGKEPAQASQPNHDPNWCSVQGSNVFVMDNKNTPQAELERLWRFANWDVSTLPDYVQKRATGMNVQVNDTIYAAILQEQVSYLKEQGFTIENIPF